MTPFHRLNIFGVFVYQTRNINLYVTKVKLILIQSLLYSETGHIGNDIKLWLITFIKRGQFPKSKDCCFKNLELVTNNIYTHWASDVELTCLSLFLSKWTLATLFWASVSENPYSLNQKDFSYRIIVYVFLICYCNYPSFMVRMLWNKEHHNGDAKQFFFDNWSLA